VAAVTAVTAVTLADVEPAVRAPTALAFMFLFPGLAVVRLLAVTRDRLAELTLGVALSVALATLIPTSLLYLGSWSPKTALAVLIAVTLGAVTAEILASAYPSARGEETGE
jgi:hypothetical protein